MADQHTCSTNASKGNTSTELGPKCPSKEKLASVQFVTNSKKARYLNGLPINGCNEGCSIALGVLIFSHLTPKPVDKQKQTYLKLPCLQQSTLQQCVRDTVQSPMQLVHGLPTWPAMWKRNTKHITVP